MPPTFGIHPGVRIFGVRASSPDADINLSHVLPHTGKNVVGPVQLEAATVAADVGSTLIHDVTMHVASDCVE